MSASCFTSFYNPGQLSIHDGFTEPALQVAVRVERNPCHCPRTIDTKMRIVHDTKSIRIEQCMKSPQYTFDRVFGSNGSEQQLMFNEMVVPLIDCNLKTSTCDTNIWLYGEANAGKRSSLVSPQNGLIPMSLNHIFRELSLKKEENGRESLSDYKVSIKLVELLDKRTIDLLSCAPESSCPMHFQDQEIIQKYPSQKPTNTRNASHTEYYMTIPVSNTEKAMASLKRGLQQSHRPNAGSHVIVTIYIQQTFFDQIKLSKINFVDLAAPQHPDFISKCKPSKSLEFRQKCEANKCLMSLGVLISTWWFESKYKRNENSNSPFSFFPYRDSLLTRTLKEDLASTSKTIFIACISSNVEDYQKQQHTLRFANRLKNRQNQAMIMEDFVEMNDETRWRTEIEVFEKISNNLKLSKIAKPQKPKMKKKMKSDVQHHYPLQSTKKVSAKKALLDASTKNTLPSLKKQSPMRKRLNSARRLRRMIYCRDTTRKTNAVHDRLHVSYNEKTKGSSNVRHTAKQKELEGLRPVHIFVKTDYSNLRRETRKVLARNSKTHETNTTVFLFPMKNVIKGHFTVHASPQLRAETKKLLARKVRNDKINCSKLLQTLPAVKGYNANTVAINLRPGTKKQLARKAQVEKINSSPLQVLPPVKNYKLDTIALRCKEAYLTPTASSVLKIKCSSDKEEVAGTTQVYSTRVVSPVSLEVKFLTPTVSYLRKIKFSDKEETPEVGSTRITTSLDIERKTKNTSVFQTAWKSDTEKSRKMSQSRRNKAKSEAPTEISSVGRKSRNNSILLPLTHVIIPQSWNYRHRQQVIEAKDSEDYVDDKFGRANSQVVSFDKEELTYDYKKAIDFDVEIQNLKPNEDRDNIQVSVTEHIVNRDLNDFHNNVSITQSLVDKQSNVLKFDNSDYNNIGSEIDPTNSSQEGAMTNTIKYVSSKHSKSALEDNRNAPNLHIITESLQKAIPAMHTQSMVESRLLTPPCIVSIDVQSHIIATICDEQTDIPVDMISSETVPENTAVSSDNDVHSNVVETDDNFSCTRSSTPDDNRQGNVIVAETNICTFVNTNWARKSDRYLELDWDLLFIGVDKAKLKPKLDKTSNITTLSLVKNFSSETKNIRGTDTTSGPAIISGGRMSSAKIIQQIHMH